MPVRPRRLAALIAVGAALLAAAPAHAAQERRAAPAPSAVPASDRVIVVWEPGASRADRLDARADADAAFVRTLGDARFQLLAPQPGQSTGDTLAALRDDPGVRVAVRDGYDVPHATTSDPLFGQLWGLQNVGAPVHGAAGALAGADVGAVAAWDRTRGSSAVVVADLDAGYRFDHPDLAPVAWSNPADPANGADDDGNGIVDDAHGADFVGSDASRPTTDGDPTDDDLVDGGHGVHTAGTIGAAGNDGVGITGVAQDVRIMPLRVCAFDSGEDATTCPNSSLIAAINYAGAHGARVANMSLGGRGGPNPAVAAALARNPQVLFVASAGNDGEDNDASPHYPCGYDPTTAGVAGAVDNVVCVAATTQADGLAAFSDWGARSVDVGAPGTEILSTYPFASVVDDTFSADDFAARWLATAGGGFQRTNEAPLTSFGMSDSPGAAPPRRTLRETTSAPVAIPPGYPSCRLTQTRALSLGGGTYTYSVLVDGSTIESFSPVSSGTFFLDVSDPRLTAGGSVQLRFAYTSGSAPSAGDGVWLDDISFTCAEPVGRTRGYGFLEGTSMAAPHVTGAAALLFSLNPAATVAQARAALLATVDPVAALAGRTSTGGRIDAAAALDEIRAPDTRITAQPRRSTSARGATFRFARADVGVAAPYECQLDGGAFAPCTSPQTYRRLSGRRHVFAVRALSPRGIVADLSPATASWTVTQCKVPKLRGKSLRRAKRALRRAKCRVGRVGRASGGVRPFVVLRTRPGAGAVRGTGAKVRLTLGPKPRPRRHQRRGRG